MQKRTPVPAIFFSSAVLISTFLSVFPVHAADSIGKVVGMAPTATKNSETPLELDSAIYMDDTVKTGHAGKLEILLSGQSRLLLGPSTVISFSYVPYGKILDKEISVKKGWFRFRASSPPDATYVIKTPAAKLYLQDADIAGEMTSSRLRLTLLEGKVSVCANGMGKQRCLVPPKKGESFIIPVKGRIAGSKTAVEIPGTCAVTGPQAELCKTSSEVKSP